MKRILSILAVVALLPWLGACDSGGPSSGSGNVRVLLTDAPIDLTGVSAVNVTFTSLVLYPASTATGTEENGVTMDLAPIRVDGEATVNLLDYRGGNTVTMASQDVPEGTYSRLRLEIASAELVRDDDGDPATPDVVEPIFVPSSKVDVTLPFTIAAGENADLTLDFDAQGSVQVNETPGQHPYILRPVINGSAAVR